MKKVILLLALVSINSYAADGLKIISKQVSHVDYAPQISSNPSAVDCIPYAYPVTGTVGNITTAKGKANYEITNATNEHKSYVIDEYMCIDNFGCTLTEYHGSLGPMNSGGGLDPIEHSEIINVPGTYTERTILIISGDGTCNVEATGPVTVK